MKNCKYKSFFKHIDFQSLVEKAEGINEETLNNVLDYFDNIIASRQTPLYIFFNPDLEKYATDLQIPVKDFFNIMMFLTSFIPNYFKMRAILKQDDLFYHLQEEDLKEIAKDNTIHHPYNPKIIYKDAYNIVRHAFVIDMYHFLSMNKIHNANIKEVFESVDICKPEDVE